MTLQDVMDCHACCFTVLIVLIAVSYHALLLSTAAVQSHLPWLVLHYKTVSGCYFVSNVCGLLVWLGVAAQLFTDNCLLGFEALIA